MPLTGFPQAGTALNNPLPARAGQIAGKSYRRSRARSLVSAGQRVGPASHNSVFPATGVAPAAKVLQTFYPEGLTGRQATRPSRVPGFQRRRAASLRLSLRLQRFLLVGVLLISLSYTAVFSWRAYQQAALLDMRLEAARQALAEAQSKQARLEAERTYLESDAALEKLAREELGLVKPGEVRIVVQDSGGPGAGVDKP